MAGVWISTLPKACTLKKKTFKRQSVMKGRSNGRDKVPPEKGSTQQSPQAKSQEG